MANGAGQKLGVHLISIRADFTKSIREKFRANDSEKTLLSSMFVDMKKIEVFFDPKSKSTIHRREANPVSVRFPGSKNKRATACVWIASDAKIPPVYSFKRTANRKLERSLKDVLV